MSRKDRPVSDAKRRKLRHSSGEDAVDDRFEGLVGAAPEDTSSSEAGDDTHSQVATQAASKRKPRAHQSSASAMKTTTNVGSNITTTTQLKELLHETTPDFDARLRKSAKATDRIIEAIRALDKAGPFGISDAERYCRKHGNIAIPFPSPRPGKESNLKYEYLAPTSIAIRGPSAQRLAIKGSDKVGIAVQMPSSLLQDKDYLNFRIFHKRAFYLSRILCGINSMLGADFDFEYGFQDGLELLPVITLSARESSRQTSHSATYVIYIDLPPASFDHGKLAPSKNCVRPSALANDRTPAATPFYNSCVLFAARQGPYYELITAASHGCSGFPDACRLGQLWLAQRGLDSAVSTGGFGWWEWAVVCALLLQAGGPRGQPLFSARYTSLQLFKAMLQVLANRDLTQPWVIRGVADGIEPADAPVLYDGNTGLNILFKMRGDSYQLLRSAAEMSLATINSKQQDGFDATFIHRVAEPSLQYDETHTFTMKRSSDDAIGQKLMLEKLYGVLKRGLADRVTGLAFKFPHTQLWSVDLSKPKTKHATFSVYLSVDPEHASRLVDHGPSAEEQEAATEFQRFWGAKSELRRFKDGSITESLVWNPSTTVTSQIIQHLLTRHFQVDPETIQARHSSLEAAVLPNTAVSAKDSFALVHQKFQSLSSTLHALPGLPLPIRSVSPASEALRSASISAPLALATAGPINVLIQFDSSSRWPDSLPAIQHTKIAFLMKLGDALSAQDTSLTTRLGLENTSTTTSGTHNTAYLDIISLAPAPGLAPLIFRLRIHHERELHLLQTALADKSLHGATRDSFASALATHRRTFLAAPAHTTALQPLMTRFPALSGTIRLLKQWISAHLLSQHIPDEALELIAVHVFVHPSPWAVPGLPTTAFLRCLWFLAKWDWAVTPLIVDVSLSQDMSGEQRMELGTRFEAWRKLDPNMNQVSWFVGSNVDESGVVWTGVGRVEKVVAARVTSLAAACMEVVKGEGAVDGLGEEAARGLFVSGLEEYDFLVYLKKGVVKGARGKSHRGKYRNLEVAEETDADVVGFDPVQEYLDDLEAAFKGVALFFYGAAGHGGNVVAGLWRPAVRGRREWKVRLGWSSLPIREKSEVEAERKVMAELNTKAILKEIEVMGEGLVKAVSSRE